MSDYEDGVFPLEKINPISILNKNRLDIIVRYLLFRDIANGIENKKILSLYGRMILARNAAHEPLGKNTFTEKIGVSDFVENAKNLYRSIKDNGFDKKFSVPIGTEGSLFNGSHRIATSIVLNEDIWVTKSDEKGFNNFGIEWFYDNGFNEDDIMMILRGYADLYSDCSIFVLFAPIQDKWDYVQQIIDNEVAVVGWVDVDYTNNYVGFENLIHDIYNSYSSDENNVIYQKIQILKMSGLSMRIMLVTNENNKNINLMEQCRIVKESVRNHLDSDINKDSFVTIHSSDTFEEFDSLRKVLLSPNNHKMIRQRLFQTCRKEFLGWLSDLKDYCFNNSIDLNSLCIVGSSPLEVAGIRNSTDIDIVVTSEYRKNYGDGATKLTETLDIATKNYCRQGKTVIVTDDVLIHDDSYHFIFNGCKFANIDMIKARKSSSSRDKDIKDVLLISKYNDFVLFFDDKSVLQEQITNEIMRRQNKTTLLTEKLKLEQNRRKALQKELLAEKNNTAFLQEKLNNALSYSDTLMIELRAERNEIKSLNSKLGVLRKEKKLLDSKLEIECSKTESLSTTLDEECGKTKSLNTKLKTEHEKIISLNNALDAECRKTKSLSATLETEHEKMISLNNTLDIERSEVQLLRKKLSVNHEKTVSIANALETEHEKILSLSNSLEAELNKVKSLNVKLDIANDELNRYKAKTKKMKRLVSSLEHEVDNFNNSTSWKITKPLRAFKNFLNRK